ncbi:MAG: 4a-hydroxytetrahydrobiopterin dehydratase [Natronomonas sp.]|jgi:4a-hydroxytetrahydrobiopterin dehydratase
MADQLSDEAVEAQLPDGWEREDTEITRTFEFDSYLDGVGFLSGVAGLAEEAWHHPEMTVTWGEVEVRLTTHEADGVTGKDIDLAERFNEVYE